MLVWRFWFGVFFVLMPCRALEAFRPGDWSVSRFERERVLMPCRALEAFRLIKGGMHDVCFSS